MSDPGPSGATEPSSHTHPPAEFGSSQVRVPGHYFAEHKREELQAFGFDEEVHPRGDMGVDAFKTLLNIPDDVLRGLKTSKITVDNFVEAANTMAKAMRKKHFPDNEFLVFKKTEAKAPLGNPSGTVCRPDFVAIFASHWLEEKSTSLWSCLQLVGEKASEGKTRDEQKKQVISYLHYLLLARPDLHIAQGLFTSISGVTFIFGIGGFGTRTFTVPWNDKALYGLMYSFLYRLYAPGHFADSSYVNTDPDLKSAVVNYTVRITDDRGLRRDIPDLKIMYSSSPFGTRTHILSNSESQVEVNGECLTVLKDQLCRIGTRFNEHGILTLVHSPKKVPGVIEAVCHESIEIPIPEVIPNSRRKHRMGMRQVGMAFTSIPTLGEVLEVVFDILEVLRYLRFERSILHRDISKGNVLYNPPPSSTPDTSPGGAGKTAESETPPPSSTPDASPGGAGKTAGSEGPCFVKYLLGPSVDPSTTSALLIDFNHAEHLESSQSPRHRRITRTGTPIFIARAVEMGRALPLPPDGYLLAAVPHSPQAYGENHPDRINKFPYAPKRFEISPTMNNTAPWRHELDHDTESVFWLLVYWLIGAQPEEEPPEDINPFIWAGLTGSVEDRIGLIALGMFERATHSFYAPVAPLLNNLAKILEVDRHWLELGDTRNDPAYLNEAFQRLVLRFILDNDDKHFMTRKVTATRRHPPKTSTCLGLSHTSQQRSHILRQMSGDKSRKRPRDSSDQQRSKKWFSRSTK